MKTYAPSCFLLCRTFISHLVTRVPPAIAARSKQCTKALCVSTGRRHSEAGVRTHIPASSRQRNAPVSGKSSPHTVPVTRGLLLDAALDAAERRATSHKKVQRCARSALGRVKLNVRVLFASASRSHAAGNGGELSTPTASRHAAEARAQHATRSARSVRAAVTLIESHAKFATSGRSCQRGAKK